MSRWITVGLALILAGAWTGNPIWAQSPAELVQEAMIAADQEDWQRAADLYQQVIETEPTNSALYNNLGVALRRAGDTQGAITAYRQTLELDPSLSTVYVNLAIALLSEQQWAEALVVLDQARIRLPDEISIVLYQGVAHEKLAQWPEAAAAYTLYTQLQPDALGYYRLAIAQWQAGNAEVALEAFRRAARLEPDVGLYQAEAGRALAKVGLTEDAIAFLEALPQTWSNPQDYILLARLAYRASHPNMAEDALQQALILSQGSVTPSLGTLNARTVPATLLNDIGVLNAERDDSEMAAAYLEAAAINADAAGSFQTGAIAYANLADVYLNQGLLDQALAAAQAAVERDPLHPPALNTLASTLLQRDRIPQAIETFETVVQLDPDYWQAHRNLGIAYALVGATDAATRSLQLAIESAPDLAVVQLLNSELIKIQSGRL